MSHEHKTQTKPPTTVCQMQTAAALAFCVKGECVLQPEWWTKKRLLASGANGSVYHTTSGHFTGCVLKTGWQHHIEAEAGLLCRLNHTNIVRFLARLSTVERDDRGHKRGSMVLQQLGPSLASQITVRGRSVPFALHVQVYAPFLPVQVYVGIAYPSVRLPCLFMCESVLPFPLCLPPWSAP